jgi:hypothetical protein
VRLLRVDECRVEGSGRATRDDRALREDVTSKRMRQCDCGVQKEGACVVSRRTDTVELPPQLRTGLSVTMSPLASQLRFPIRKPYYSGGWDVPYQLQLIGSVVVILNTSVKYSPKFGARCLGK